MPLNFRKLTQIKEQADGTVVARCPACAAANLDKAGNHLVVYPDGRFGCVVNPGAEGRQHRRRIWELAGEKASRRPPLVISFTVKPKERR